MNCLIKHMEVRQLTELLGQTLRAVAVNADQNRLTMITVNGKVFVFYHDQDCCESVNISDIVGDLTDLVGSPILLAEEIIHEGENPEGVTAPDFQDDSYTWTFYKFATLKGYVDVRWYGESNGYYSETVTFAAVA